MGFTEAFIECMQGAGVQGDLQGLAASQDAALQQINSVKGVYQGLEGGDMAAVDAITKDYGGAKILAEGGASGADELLAIIDASVGWDIPTILQYCDYCIEQAAAAEGAAPAEPGATESEGTESQTEEGA